jgi:glutamate dehydrogenase/leucine dehydrogenase
VITLSDSNGTIYIPDGLTKENWGYVMDLKNVKRGRIKECKEEFGCEFHEGERPWKFKCDIALPCATQNEVNVDDAKTLLDNGVIALAEGANMPSTPEAIDAYLEAGILYGPGKAANAGGVATSGLEMCQNHIGLSWSREKVDKQLHSIMVNIHEACIDAAKKYGFEGNYVAGANIAGFVKVADSMMDQGIW